MFIILLLIGLSLTHTVCFAQDKRLTDPGISVHNYKHPNKAIQAKALGYDQGVSIDLKKAFRQVYKHQNENNLATKSSPYPFIVKKMKVKETVNSKNLVEIRQKDEDSESL